MIHDANVCFSRMLNLFHDYIQRMLFIAWIAIIQLRSRLRNKAVCLELTQMCEH